MRKSPITKLLTLLVLTMTMAFGLGLAASAQDTLPAKVKAASTTSAKVSWTKMAGADKYVVYYTLCHTSFSEKKTITVVGSKSSCIVKNLKAKKLYKFKVKAYSGTTLLAESMQIHHAGSRNSTYTNPKSVTIGPASATLTTGDTLDLTVTIKKQKSGKKLIAHDAKVRYYSTDPAVATVTADGKVTAVKDGSCKIYAVAQNGISKAMKLTVVPSLTGEKVVETQTVTEEVYILSYAWNYEGGKPATDPKLPSAVKLKEGAAVTLPTAPALEGYTFKGWDFTGKTMPKKDVVVTGTYVKDEEFSITYVLLMLYYDDDAEEYKADYVGKEVLKPFKKGTKVSEKMIFSVTPHRIISTSMVNGWDDGWNYPYLSFLYNTWLPLDDYYWGPYLGWGLLSYLYEYGITEDDLDLSSAELDSFARTWPEDLFNNYNEEDMPYLIMDQNYVLFAVVNIPRPVN